MGSPFFALITPGCIGMGCEKAGQPLLMNVITIWYVGYQTKTGNGHMF